MSTEKLPQPGPWTFKEGTLLNAFHLFDGNGDRIGSFNQTGNDTGQGAANATLLVSASVMLDALRSLVGMEAWIGDREMKELFQNKVYGAIEKATTNKS